MRGKRRAAASGGSQVTTIVLPKPLDLFDGWLTLETPLTGPSVWAVLAETTFV